MAARQIRKHGRYLEVPSQRSLDSALSNRHAPRIALPRQTAIQDLEEVLPGRANDVDMREICEKVLHLELCPEQRHKLEVFLRQKQCLGDFSSENFEKEAELGCGNSGIVERVRHLDSGLLLARKEVRLDVKPSTRQQIIREMQLLHGCISPYLVGFFGASFHAGDISLYLEYMDGGSAEALVAKCGRLPRLVLSRIVTHVLRGLLFLRNQIRIAHQDVKPSNILLNTDGEVKLCDFCVSTLLMDSTINSFVGTRSYMAPERLSGEPHAAPCDIWSLGLTTVELAIGRYPIPSPSAEDFRKSFCANLEENLTSQDQAAKQGLKLPPLQSSAQRHMTIFELLSCIVEHPPPRLPAHAFAASLLGFSDLCLRRDPHERGTLDALLKHPFIAEAEEFNTEHLAVYLAKINKS